MNWLQQQSAFTLAMLITLWLLVMGTGVLLITKENSASIGALILLMWAVITVHATPFDEE